MGKFIGNSSALTVNFKSYMKIIIKSITQIFMGQIHENAMKMFIAFSKIFMKFSYLGKLHVVIYCYYSS